MEDFDSFSMSDEPNYYSPSTEDVQTFLKEYRYSNMDESSNEKFPYEAFISIWQPKSYSEFISDSEMIDEQNLEQNEHIKICPDCKRNKLDGNSFNSAIKIYATQNLIESQANLLKTVCLGKVLSFI